MKEEKPKPTLEQKIIVYKKISEWLRNTDKKEHVRVLEMLKKEMNKKTSATLKGKMPKNIPIGFWWNNGKINKRTYECPGIEWNRGKL